jgi:ssDNA-binding Zn-finger/Zn-ribbon topoisomerase 1
MPRGRAKGSQNVHHVRIAKPKPKAAIATSCTGPPCPHCHVPLQVIDHYGKRMLRCDNWHCHLYLQPVSKKEVGHV